MSDEKKKDISHPEMGSYAEEEEGFEEVLKIVGGWGRYQFTLLAFFFATCVFLAYSVYTPVLFLYTPDHWCSVDHLVQNSSLTKDELTSMLIPRNEDGTRMQCVVYNIDANNVSVGYQIFLRNIK